MATDNSRSGSREFSDQQLNSVVSLFSQLSYPRSIDSISAMTGVPGRTVRAIIAARDGIDFLVAGGDSGLMPAGTSEESESMTNRLDSQASQMRDRVARRRKYARERMIPVQGALL
jgi:hypothetical protein